MNDAARPPRLLPVWIVVKRSFAYAWERRDVLAIPYLIYAAVTIVVDLGLDYATAGEQSGTAVAAIVNEVFGMAFAVAIQRFVLLGEAGKGAAFFRWDRHFVRYLVNALLLSLAVGMSFLFLFVLFENIGLMMGVVDANGMPIASPRTSALSLLALTAVVALAALVSRLVLTLPASALGQADRLRLVWAATRGNGFRLLATSFLVLLPFIAVELALLRGSAGDQGAGATTGPMPLLAEIASGLIAPLQLVVFTIMLALEYDALVRGGGPARISR